MTGRLSSKRAVVTGAASGIGRKIAERFGEEGMRVAMLDVDVDNLEEASGAIDAETLPLECDVRETASVESAIGQTTDAWDGIDVVVNNAGIVLRKALVDTSDEEIDRVIDVNLKGVIRVARTAIPALQESHGTLINMSSIAAREGIHNRSIYAATKGGISSLTHQLAVELGPDIRVNAIAPGTIKTPIWGEQRRQDESYVERRLSKVPMERIGTPEDIAGAAVFLASEDADYVNGHVLPVDGGRTKSWGQQADDSGG